MIDIGLNLSNNQFSNDMGLVLERAFASGLKAMVLTGTDLDSSTESARICEKYSEQYPQQLFSTAGLHPHDAKDWNSDLSDHLEVLLKLPKVLAVGETGLDFNRDFSPRDMQIKAFEGQLELAANTGLPLFLHERDAFSTQIEILRSHRDHFEHAVIHCFTGDKAALFAYLDLDLHIGITGWVCDERRGADLAALVPNIPLHRLMIETDAPYLLPRNIVPKPKSRRNEPAYLKWVIQKIAECYEMEQQEISQRSTANAQAFFGLASD
jgi:TatD DNase family protein